VPLSDPKDVVTDLFRTSGGSVTPGNLTDDNGSNLRYDACYEMGEQRLIFEFRTRKTDILFVVGQTGISQIPEDGPPVAYVHHVFVQPACVDRYSSVSTGAKSNTATVAVNKASQEVRRVIAENLIGSNKHVPREDTTYQRLGSDILWGVRATVDYVQYIDFYGWTYSATYDLNYRRFHGYIYEIQLGSTSSVYNRIGAPSGLTARWEPNPDPYVELEIPAGSTNVVQALRTGQKRRGWFAVRDHDAVTQLLYTIDVGAAGGTQKAIESGNTRTVIGHMAILTKSTRLDNSASPNTRSIVTGTYTFTNAIILDPIRDFTAVAAPVRVNFLFDSETETLA
jgi:hypothetical protein